MAVDIGPRIGIEGEREYRQKLQEIIAGQKTLASEAKAVSAAMKDETDAEKRDAAQKDVLTRQILNQKEKLEQLEKGLQASAKKYGEADVKTQKWQQAVYEAQATLSNMERELRGTDSQVEELGDDMRDAGESAAGWADVMKGTLLADAVKSGLNWMKDTVQKIGSKIRDASEAGAAYADEILTISTVSGIGAEELQSYAYMADLVDVSLDTVTGSLSKMTKSMASAVKGKGAAAEAWKKLNVGIKNADGSMRKADDVFRDTLDALRKIENPTERDALAMEIFGKSAQELNPLISAGADRLEEFRKEAKDAGAVLSGPALQALGKQQDAMDRLDRKTEALSNRFAARLAPSAENATKKLLEVADNPRVRRGLDVIADGVGSLIDGAVELAGKALPGLFEVLSFGDERLKYYTDDQLALVQAMEDQAEAHQGLIDEYKANASGILDETQRVKDLWGELQTLADENGNVQEKDQARAQFILTQLNEALGTEYGLNDGIIGQYQTMQSEIDKLIEKRQAEALLAARADSAANAMESQEEALSTAAKLAEEVASAQQKARSAADAYTRAMQYAERYADGTEEGEDRRLQYIEKYRKAARDAQDAYKSLSGQLQDAREKAQSYYEETANWQAAQTAAASGNYAEVVRILTSEFNMTLEYYREKKRLNEEEKRQLAEKITDAERNIREYKRNLDAGLRGFSEAGLKEMQEYVNEAKRILNGEELGKQFSAGLAAGISAKASLMAVENATTSAARVIKATTKAELRIASPSKIGEYMGEMWPAGIAKGMRKREAELRRTAAGLSASVIGAGSLAPAVGQYGGALAAPIGTLGVRAGGSSHTTNVGGVTIQIPGAQGVNEDVLAKRVAVRLTQEINRANRARGG